MSSVSDENRAHRTNYMMKYIDYIFHVMGLDGNLKEQVKIIGQVLELKNLRLEASLH